MKSKYIRQRIKINHTVTIFVKRKVTRRAASSSSSSSSGGGRSAYSSNYFTFYICTTKRGKIWVQFLAAVAASAAVVDRGKKI